MVRKVKASAGKYLWRLCIDPINNFKCDRIRGRFSESICSVFRTNGVLPVWVILWPNHSDSRCANLNFVNFRDMFSLSSFFQSFLNNRYVVNFGSLGY